MPIRRGYRKKRAPRFRRLRRNYGRRMRMYKKVGSNPVPLRMRTKLKYVDTILVNVAANNNIYYTYQNSLFDPYVAVGGHQPLYFDQYAAMYGFYRVYGIGYTVEAQATTSSGQLVLCVYPQTDSSVAGSISWACEKKFSKFMAFGNQYKARLRGYVSVANLWAVSKKDVNIDDQFAANVTADPIKKIYLFIQGFNATATASDLLMTIKLTYYCEFFRPITVNQS